MSESEAQAIVVDASRNTRRGHHPGGTRFRDSMEDLMDEETVNIVIKYNIGYGSHQTEMEVSASATDEEINEMVWDMLAERLDYGWEKE